MNAKYYLRISFHTFVSSVLIAVLMASSYFLIEPQVGRAQDTSGPFTISQVITGETSFIVDAVNTTLSGSLNGITGGTANGSTTVVVQTNSPTGYTMDIAFYDNGTGQTMLGEVTDSSSIIDYPASSSEPTFLFSTASTAALFAYTVSAADSSDLDQSFLDNGSACNTGSGYTADRCWMEPATTPSQIRAHPTRAVPGSRSSFLSRFYLQKTPSPGLGTQFPP